jgi:ribosomal protein S18 acetylase RimI-like enzyme
MRIEPVSNIDLIPLSHIERDMFGEDAFGVFLLHHYLQEHIFFHKIVSENDEIIGFGIVAELNTAILNPHELNFITDFLPSKIAHLIDFVIRKQYWSQGYGKKLLSHFENQLVNEKFDYFFLEVNSKSNRAVNFYIRREFKTIGKIQGYYNTGNDAYLMIKKLETF